MTKGREEGQEWTQKERVEQLAVDIIHASTLIQGLLLQGHCGERVYQSARAIGFHASGILKALGIQCRQVEVEDE